MHKYLFIGNIIPGDDINPKVDVQKATYLAQKGIMDALSSQTDCLTVLSYPQYPSYSKSHIIWSKGDKQKMGKMEVIRIATFNLPFLRIIFRNLIFLYYIISWCIANKNYQKHIIQYNVSSPALFVTLVGHLFKKTDISAFLYDLGMPPSSYNYSWAKRMVFKIIDIHAKYLINKLDYVYVITSSVAADYAKKTKSLLIDGGISEDVLNRLPLNDNRDKSKTVLLIAGNLTESNGVDLLLDTSQILCDKDIEFWFAGKGDSVVKINSYAEKDKRIRYMGYLTTEQLFDLYSKCDVLLNLRNMPEDEGRYLFPSKLLEYMSSGRLVISTDIAHVREQYGNYCEVIDSPTAKTLAKKIMSIRENKDNDKALRSQEYMLKTHTWDAQINKIIKLLEKQ